MEVGVNYKLFSDMSDIKSEGEAKATLDEQYLTLNLMFGDPMLLAYTDIVEISEYDYKVDFFLISKEKLNLCGLGYEYEDFLFQLYKFRNEQMLKYLLMQESVFQAGFEAQFTQFDVDGQIGKTGSCELRLYDMRWLFCHRKMSRFACLTVRKKHQQTGLQTNPNKRIPRKD